MGHFRQYHGRQLLNRTAHHRTSQLQETVVWVVSRGSPYAINVIEVVSAHLRLSHEHRFDVEFQLICHSL